MDFGGISMEKTPEAALARFLACTEMPRRFEARRKCADELTDVLVSYGWKEDDASFWVVKRLMEKGWTFYSKKEIAEVDGGF